jgi:hypothetical protein
MQTTRSESPYSQVVRRGSRFDENSLVGPRQSDKLRLSVAFAKQAKLGHKPAQAYLNPYQKITYSANCAGGGSPKSMFYFI